MQRTPQFITGDFTPHHLFLEDAEYGRALDALVKAVSDVLVTSADASKIYLGLRKVEPQPDWWYIGGRAKPGETPQQAAARNVRRELGLDLSASRFTVIANYSFVWAFRQQPPSDHGTADISTVHRLTLLPEEEAKVKLDENEYRDARWFDCDEVLAGEFHPALKQAIQDLRLCQAYEALENAGSDDAEVARLARALVAAMGKSACKEPVHVNFDADARVYKRAECIDAQVAQPKKRKQA
eukprot:TRINITY_DN109276_c0_g1_i1.p1 TRINITY_DN109276_c0_g1~~TRINITY_DN109276_c0_g1_i1.p1  ORF type:complete len:240 (-),score=53.73 TRINITY_DN109276_c0_g1_i1:28-747(-)